MEEILKNALSQLGFISENIEKLLAKIPVELHPLVEELLKSAEFKSILKEAVGKELAFSAGDFTHVDGKVTAKVKDNQVQLLALMGSVIKALPFGMNIMALQDAFSLVDGQAFVVPVYLDTDSDIKAIGCLIHTAGNYTPDQTNGLAIYSESQGKLTKLAETANDGNLWKTTGAKTVPLVKPLTLKAGKYHIACLYNCSAQTAAPQIAGDVYSVLFSYFEAFGIVPSRMNTAVNHPASIDLAKAPKAVQVPALFLI